VIVRMPGRPLDKASQFLSNPVPSGVTSPSPVMTTLRCSVVFTNPNQVVIELEPKDRRVVREGQ
jgi:hypothetical protein